MMKRIALLGLTLLLSALPAFAQQQYGTIAGTVFDNERQPLPGVTVTLSGPAMQGTRTAATDDQGRYRFVPVPPGSDYTVRFELSGFNTLDQSRVTANIGRETTIDAEMALSQFAETITVAADRIVVDTTKSTVSTAVEWDLIDTLTTDRTFQSVMELAPGVQVGANNPRVHGASDGDNVYLVDGVDTTDPRTQTWGTAINFDTIAEVQVQTAAFAAEYGRAAGGIVNLVTKSGGNEFSGTLRYVQTDVDWAADPKEGVTPTTLSNEKRPAAALGGPIARDRLWFFVAYESRDREQTFPRATDSSNTEFYTDTSTYKGHYLSGKLTWQLNPNHSLVGYYNEDPIDISNAWGRYYLGTGVDPRSEATQQQGGFTGTLQWTGVLSPSLFLEARYGTYNGEINVIPQGPLGPEPTYLDYATGYWSGTTLEYYTSERTRENITFALNKFIESGSGSHQIKAGAEWLEVRNTVVDAYYPSGGTTAPGEFVGLWEGEPVDRTVYFDRPGALETKNPYWALYVQDAWKIGNVTLNLGVRAEQVALKNNVGEEVVTFDLQDQIAPRLGFAWDINGSSLHGSASRFYDIVSDYVTAGLNENDEKATYYTWDGAEWVEEFTYPRFANNFVDPDLKPQYTDEFTIGYDQRLGDNWAISANYVNRQTKDAIEDVDAGILGDPVADDGEFYYTNVPETWMKYQGIELGLKKRMAADRIQFIASYTYVLQNEGVWSGTGNNSFADQLGGYADNSSAVDNRYGDLDTPHLAKFDGSYTFPFNLTIGLSAYYYSGPYYAWFRRVSTAKGTANAFTETPGQREVGSVWQADLHLEQAFKLGKGISVAIYGDALNVTDNQDPTGRQGRITSGAFQNPTAWQTMRRYQVGAKFEF
jgi:outer membrane receptor for ferrienterochelin and colicin